MTEQDGGPGQGDTTVIGETQRVFKAGDAGGLAKLLSEGIDELVDQMADEVDSNRPAVLPTERVSEIIRSHHLDLVVNGQKLGIRGLAPLSASAPEGMSRLLILAETGLSDDRRDHLRSLVPEMLAVVVRIGEPIPLEDEGQRPLDATSF